MLPAAYTSLHLLALPAAFNLIIIIIILFLPFPASFPCEAESAVLHEGSIYSIEGNNVQVRSLQGTVKQTLNFTESEGQPIGLDVCGNFLVTSTINGIIKLWDLSRRYGIVSPATDTELKYVFSRYRNNICSC